jgi:hypothetical protein
LYGTFTHYHLPVCAGALCYQLKTRHSKLGEKITSTYRFPQANLHKDSSMLFGTIGSHFPGLELLEINSPSPIFPEWVEI